MKNMFLNDSTAGISYLQRSAAGMGIALVATSLINPQLLPEKETGILPGSDMAFFEMSRDSYLTNAKGTGGIVTGKIEANYLYENNLFDEVESPVMHAKKEYKITLKIKSIAKGRPFSKYELEG